MNRARTIIKSTLCVTAASTVLMFAKAPAASAASTDVSSETGIAGISLSMDKYYTAVIENNAQPADLSNTDTDNQKEEAKKETTEKKETKKESVYKNTGISVAPSYVNIRSKAKEDSKVLGKLYKGSAATIKETKGDWVKVKSGSVTGYIKKQYLAIGESAEKIAKQYGTKFATIDSTTVRVREKKSKDSTTLTLVPAGEKFEVLKETGNWVKIGVDDDIKGYVSKDCVTTKMKFDKAVSIEEEKAKEAAKKAEEEQEAQQQAQEAKAAQEQAAQAQQAQQAAQAAQTKRAQSSTSSSSTTRSSASTSSSSSKSSAYSSSSATTKSQSSNSGSSSASATTSSSSASTSTSTGSGSGSSVASYALQFRGNPYVMGGTSLTNGTDCSGFTQSVYRHFGYSIPRTASSQAAGAGTRVSLSSLKPGDLIFYTKGGSVNHVALYIGGGRVVHASTPSTGIIVTGMNYRTPYMAKRVIK